VSFVRSVVSSKIGYFFLKMKKFSLRLLRPYSPTPVNVNCRLKCFVTLVTYCYNNIFVYFNLQLTLTGVGEYGPYSVKYRQKNSHEKTNELEVYTLPEKLRILLFVNNKRRKGNINTND
jgi:hypothetical protein